MKTSGLLIASGLSSRINKFKPLLDYNGKSFLANILEKILSIVDEVTIVVGHNYPQILAELKKLFNEDVQELNFGLWKIDTIIQIIYNTDYEKGMFTSLKAGIEKMNKCDWVLYHFIDQPAIPLSFYHDLVKRTNKGYNWIQPKYEDSKGHPILFDKKVSRKIIKSDSTANLRMIMKDESIQKKFYNCEYPQVLQDIDTDEDYRELLRKEL